MWHLEATALIVREAPGTLVKGASLLVSGPAPFGPGAGVPVQGLVFAQPRQPLLPIIFSVRRRLHSLCIPLPALLIAVLIFI